MRIVRVLLVAILVCATSSLVSAQSFYKNLQVINMGLGIGGHYTYYSSFSSASPAIGISYEKGFHDDWGPGVIGIGGYIGTKSHTYKGTTSDGRLDYKWRNTIIGARGTYHYNPFDVSELDLYGGLGLSYHLTTIKDRSDYVVSDRPLRSSPDYVDMSLFLGGRYYFNSDWAGFMELGYGISAVTIGASYQF
ncbi:MAG: outer membrane beta-barrel protein [Bacteroidia bacterium]|nr:porin family protein [Bacteroidia bacterium]NNC86697.1 outer membrane beta-barrel protein [Bacteroidia bacterium]NNM16612.1 outer membrane beta-barrel protein [Bacteroidia bacterium]